MEWAKSEQYQHILQGNYVQASSSPALVVTEKVARACPNCGHLASSTAPFCLACGNSLENARLVCANCHIKVFSTWQTCRDVGVC